MLGHFKTGISDLLDLGGDGGMNLVQLYFPFVMLLTIIFIFPSSLTRYLLCSFLPIIFNSSSLN